MVGTTDFVWGVIAIVIAFLVLAISILASVLIHARRIKESENRFRVLFDRVFDLLMLIDSEGRIVNVNTSTCRRLQYTCDELQGKYLRDLQSPAEGERLAYSMAHITQAASQFIGETVLIDKDGVAIDVEGALVGFDYSNEKLIVASFRDITERKSADEALRLERQSLKEKNIALKEVLQYIEEEKTEIKKNVSEKVEQTILPILKKMSGAKEPVKEVYYKMVVDELSKLTYAGSGLQSLIYKLSPREIEICKLLRGGASTKEVAEILHISVATVNKHRERIRSRLDIANKDINLTSFLQNLTE